MAKHRTAYDEELAARWSVAKRALDAGDLGPLRVLVDAWQSETRSYEETAGDLDRAGTDSDALHAYLESEGHIGPDIIGYHGLTRELEAELDEVGRRIEQGERAALRLRSLSEWLGTAGRTLADAERAAGARGAVEANVAARDAEKLRVALQGAKVRGCTEAFRAYVRDLQVRGLTYNAIFDHYVEACSKLGVKQAIRTAQALERRAQRWGKW